VRLSRAWPLLSRHCPGLRHALHILSQDVQRHFGADVLKVFIWKWVDPIHDLIVPNGCSTV
jgi:hypothetical protein